MSGVEDIVITADSHPKLFMCLDWVASLRDYGGYDNYSLPAKYADHAEIAESELCLASAAGFSDAEMTRLCSLWAGHMDDNDEPVTERLLPRTEELVTKFVTDFEEDDQ